MAFSRRLRILLRRALHTADSPERTAAAFSLGLFLGFSPLLGLHTLLALGLAFLLRLNRIAVLLGTFILNPWTAVPIYGGGLGLGLLLLGRGDEGLDAFTLPATGPFELNRFLDALGTYLVPFLVGNLVLGALVALAAYPGVLLLVRRRRRARRAAADLVASRPE